MFLDWKCLSFGQTPKNNRFWLGGWVLLITHVVSQLLLSIAVSIDANIPDTTPNSPNVYLFAPLENTFYKNIFQLLHILLSGTMPFLGTKVKHHNHHCHHYNWIIIITFIEMIEGRTVCGVCVCVRASYHHHHHLHHWDCLQERLYECVCEGKLYLATSRWQYISDHAKDLVNIIIIIMDLVVKMS